MNILLYVIPVMLRIMLFKYEIPVSLYKLSNIYFTYMMTVMLTNYLMSI